MGIFDTLFGGGSTSTTPIDVSAPEFAATRPIAQAFIEQFLTSGGPAPQGPLAAPLTEQQLGLIDQAVQGVTSPVLGAAGTQLQQTLSGEFLPGQAGANPFLAAAIEAAQRPVVRQFEDVIVPQLLSRFTGAGQEVQGGGSSAFAREARLAGQGFQDVLADIGTRISAGAFEQERGRQLQAVQAAGQLSSAELERLETGLRASALPQLVQDLGIERGLAEFNNLMTRLLQVLQIAGGVGAPVVTSAQRGEQTGGIIPGIAALLSTPIK